MWYSNVYSNGTPMSGGEAGIRTLGGREASTVFETAAFDHSATSPVNTSLSSPTVLPRGLTVLIQCTDRVGLLPPLFPHTKPH